MTVTLAKLPLCCFGCEYRHLLMDADGYAKSGYYCTIGVIMPTRKQTCARRKYTDRESTPIDYAKPQPTRICQNCGTDAQIGWHEVRDGVDSVVCHVGDDSHQEIEY